MRNYLKKLPVSLWAVLTLSAVLLIAGWHYDPTPAHAQSNLLTVTRSLQLGRLSNTGDFSMALNATANDTSHTFGGAKWISAQGTVSGTTPSVLAIMQCGLYFGSTIRWTNVDTITIAATGTFFSGLNTPAANVCRIIWDGQSGSGADVVVDSVSIGRNW